MKDSVKVTRLGPIWNHSHAKLMSVNPNLPNFPTGLSKKRKVQVNQSELSCLPAYLTLIQLQDLSLQIRLVNLSGCLWQPAFLKQQTQHSYSPRCTPSSGPSWEGTMLQGVRMTLESSSIHPKRRTRSWNIKCKLGDISYSFCFVQESSCPVCH